MELRVYCEYFSRILKLIKDTRKHDYILFIYPDKYKLFIAVSELEEISFEVKERQTENISINIRLDAVFVHTIAGLLIRDTKSDIVITLKEENSCLVTYGDLTTKAEAINTIEPCSTNDFTLEDASNIQVLPSFTNFVPLNRLHTAYLNGNVIVGWDTSNTIGIFKEVYVTSNLPELVLTKPHILAGIISDVKQETSPVFFTYEKANEQEEFKYVVYLFSCYLKIGKEQLLYTISYKIEVSKTTLGTARHMANIIIESRKNLLQQGKLVTQSKESIQNKLQENKTKKETDRVLISQSAKLTVDEFNRLFSIKSELIGLILKDNLLLLKHTNVDIITTVYRKV